MRLASVVPSSSGSVGATSPPRKIRRLNKAGAIDLYVVLVREHQHHGLFGESSVRGL